MKKTICIKHIYFVSSLLYACMDTIPAIRSSVENKKEHSNINHEHCYNETNITPSVIVIRKMFD